MFTIREIQGRKFLDNQLSIEEANDYLEWVVSDEATRELSDQIEEQWKRNDEAGYPEFDQKTLLTTINLLKGKSAPTVSMAKTRQLSWFDWRFKVAASIVLITVSVWGGYVVQYSQSESEEASRVTKSNPAGQKSKIHLPDGTLVHLNASSSITYSSEFEDNRQVTLMGEAFFEVKKDSLHPFSVKSQHITTTALGTSFNVASFDNSPLLEVQLLTGKIQVVDTITHQKLIVLPGQGVRLEKDMEVLEKFKIETSIIAVWRNGLLRFDMTPLQEVMKRLEDWYGVDIEIRGSSENILCSGVFDNEYLDNVLDVLSHSVEFEFTINHKKVTINMKAN